MTRRAREQRARRELEKLGFTLAVSEPKPNARLLRKAGLSEGEIAEVLARYRRYGMAAMNDTERTESTSASLQAGKARVTDGLLVHFKELDDLDAVERFIEAARAKAN